VKKSKIILGTVQLGMPYGVNNTSGRPSEEEAFRILDVAFDNGITMLDTADGYGAALDVIGKHYATSQKSFKIINKFKGDAVHLKASLEKALQILQRDSVYCYMYHQFADYASGAAASELNELKRLGKLEKIGISLYHIEELKTAVADPAIEVIQLPVNLLDLSREKTDLLLQAKAKGKEIHARSVYLQGLLLKDTHTINGKLSPLKKYLVQFHSACVAHQVDPKEAAFAFVCQKPFVDHVVIGIDNATQLLENLQLTTANINADWLDLDVAADDAYLLNPSTWKE
jgi:uncharacterized protein